MSVYPCYPWPSVTIRGHPSLMPKLKTHKATAKRLTITKRGKVIKRKSGQDHFNSRESGKTRMGKRRDITFDPLLALSAKRAMPYS